ncbi:MAG: hypothetical protein HKN22_09020, partial [Bacteroidia bacterium]|nr:hypothetical protein [Bacteroidia bacterium]
MQLKTYSRNQSSKCLAYLLVVLVFFPIQFSDAQINSNCKGTDNKKAEKLFSKAESARRAKKEYRQIKEAYLNVFAEDSAYAEAYFALANYSYQKDDFETAMRAYDNYIRYCENAKSKYYYRRAQCAFFIRDFQKAIKFYTSFLDGSDLDPKMEQEAVLNRYRAESYNNPVPFDPHPLEGISTIDPEYLPIISADGELCFFTRRFNISSKNSLTPKSVEKFMYANKKGESFDLGRPLPNPFNKKESNNEGGATITLDNQQIYFTVNDNGNFDLYTSTYRNKT